MTTAASNTPALPLLTAFANAMLSHLTDTCHLSWHAAANAMLKANVRGEAWMPEHRLTCTSQYGVALYTLWDAS